MALSEDSFFVSVRFSFLISFSRGVKRTSNRQKTLYYFHNIVCRLTINAEIIITFPLSENDRILCIRCMTYCCHIRPRIRPSVTYDEASSVTTRN